MADYKQVSDALASGADPELICGTCPWDRFCITPPSMTAQDVEAQMAKAKAEDERKVAEAKAEGKDPGMPIGSLLSAVMVAGRDTQAQVCPVFAARLRSSAGSEIVAGLRKQMLGWDDNGGA